MLIHSMKIFLKKRERFPIKLSVAFLLYVIATSIVCAGDITYIYTDLQGTPIAEASVDGSVINIFDYAPGGKQVLGGAMNGPGYAGHVNDVESGFIYMQARYYDAEVGYFLGEDPVNPGIGNYFNFNRFSYANNNSIRYTDPDGRMIGIDNTPYGNFYRDGDARGGRGGFGDRFACEAVCLSTETRNAWGGNEVPLGSSYVGRQDSVPGTDLYEIHVYTDNAGLQKALRAGISDLDRFEVGVVGPTGEWINKHGHTEPPDLPGGVRNAIRGQVADQARARRWLGEKGTVNIQGARLSAAIEQGMAETNSLRYLSRLGKALAPVQAGATILGLMSTEMACSNGTAQAGGIANEICP